MVNKDEKVTLIASYVRLITCLLLHRNFGNIPYSMGKNYRRHQIGIQEIVQLNSNKHGFKSSHSLLFYKDVFLKFCRTHMKTLENCTSNEKKFHCRRFPVNFAKFL